MAEETIWTTLIDAEKMPLFSWAGSDGVSQLMRQAGEGEEGMRRLVQTFAPSRSGAYAMAVMMALGEYTKELAKGQKLDWWLLYFEHLRLRSHQAILNSLVSRVSYLVQVEGVEVRQRERLAELCYFALEYGEGVEMLPESVAKFKHLLEGTELIAEYGFTGEARESGEITELFCWLQRAREMLGQLERNEDTRRLGIERKG